MSKAPLRINPELKKTLSELTAKHPQLDCSRIVDKIVSNRLIRLPQTAIRSGAQAFFQSKKPAEQPQPNAVEMVEAEPEGKPRKRVKKNEFVVEFEDSPEYDFGKLGGVEQIHAQLKQQLFILFEQEAVLKQISQGSPNRGFLISGSVGTGKTLLARCILSYLTKLPNKKVSGYEVSSYDLLGGDSEERLKKLFEAAEESAPSVVFIDNLEELCNKDNNKRMQGLPSLTMCNMMRKSKDKEIYFIGASCAPQKLDVLSRPGLFYKQFRMPNPDQGMRQDMIQKILSNTNHCLTADQIKQTAIMSAGFVTIDLVALLKQAVLKCLNRTKGSEEEVKEPQVSMEDMRSAFKVIQPVLKKDGFAKIPTVRLDDVGGLEQIKTKLKQEIIMPLRQQSRFKKMNFEVRGGGILMYGPPGCGKTMIAKAIANQANASFITVKGPQLLSKYVGQSEESVRRVFERARQCSPCIIFFDEFDALAPKRSDQGNQVTQRVVNTLLNELDGVDERKMVFVIAATNRLDIIDEAVLRSGRIENQLEVPRPNEAERLQILEKTTRKVEHEAELGLEEVAALTEGYSGADLYLLVKKAVLAAIAEERECVTARDIRAALQAYRQDKYRREEDVEVSSDSEGEPSQGGGSTSMKKARSMVEVEQNESFGGRGKREKDSKAELFNRFMDFMLHQGRKSKI